MRIRTLARTSAIVCLYLGAAYVSLALLGQGFALKGFQRYNPKMMPDGGGMSSAKITYIGPSSFLNPNYTVRISAYSNDIVIPGVILEGGELSGIKAGSTVNIRTWGNVRYDLPPYVMGLDLLENGQASVRLNYETSVNRLVAAMGRAPEMGETRIKQAIIPPVIAILAHLGFLLWSRSTRRRDASQRQPA